MSSRCPAFPRSALPLHAQRLPAAPPATKIRTGFLGTALADALGGPAEFHSRFSYDFITEMLPNGTFRLSKGVWTDDTSGALALGRAIAGTAIGEAADDEDAAAAAQLDAYYRWWQHGVLSATDLCFDIGNTTQRALTLYHKALPPSSRTQKVQDDTDARQAAARVALPLIARDLRGAVFGGNGSLMRVLPVGLAYWGAAPEAVQRAARRSSAVTHPNEVCQEACAVWAGAIASVVRSAAASGGEAMTKLDILHHFAAFPYATPVLRKALVAEVPLPAEALRDPAAMEAHYATHHPILRLVVAQTSSSPSSSSPSQPAALTPTAIDADDLHALITAILPPAKTLPSSGYVLHTIVAALYAFLATPTFEAGALLTANMGDDADTVGAVYGGLAGVWYGVEESESDVEGQEGAFWMTPRVRRWRDELVRKEVIEAVVGEVVGFAERWEV